MLMDLLLSGILSILSVRKHPLSLVLTYVLLALNEDQTCVLVGSCDDERFVLLCEMLDLHSRQLHLVHGGPISLSFVRTFIVASVDPRVNKSPGILCARCELDIALSCAYTYHVSVMAYCWLTRTYGGTG